MGKPRILDSAPVAAGVLVILTAILSLPGLGAHSLVRMEGMIAAIAQEMLASGDFVVSRLYGEIYTYKPPLLYWLVAGALRATGSSAEWVIRLPGALSGLLMGLATLMFAGRIAGYRLGLVSAIAALTGALSLQKLRIVEFDAPLAALVGVAIAAACYALARDGERGSGWAWWICYPALAAGVLTKGLPALMLFVPGLLAAAWAVRRLRALARWPHVAGVATFILLVTAYFAAAYAAAGWEVFRQPLEEARLRAADWSPAAAGRTFLKPLWIGIYFLPWSAALFWGRSGAGDRETAAGRLRRAAWGFLIAGTLAAMAVPTHESRYYLPLAVPLGIVSGAALVRMTGSAHRAARLLPAGLAAATGLAVLALGLVRASPAISPGALTVVLGLGVAALGVGATMALGRQVVGGPATALLMTALCFWGAETFVFGPGRAASRDQRPAALELLPSVPPGETLWVLSPAGLAGSYSGLLHYLGRPVRTFDGAAGPPPGVLCLVREVDLERLGPAARRRLEPIASARGPRWTYRLYRSTT